MAEQRLHSQLGPIDVLTRVELEETLSHQFEQAERTRLRGLELQRFPFLSVPCTISGTLNLSGTQGGTSDVVLGPEQGDVWMVRRIIVKSSVFADTAKYLLFRGSTPSDISGAYSFRYLLDGMIGGATPGLNVNVGFYPGTKAIYLQPGEQIYAQVLTATAGNQYAIDGEAIRVPAEMKGKVLT